MSGGTQEQLAPAVQELHRRYLPDVGSWTFPGVEELHCNAEAGGDIAAVWSRVDRKLTDPSPVDSLFEPPVVSLYPWTATYSTDTYLAMLSTQSSYALADRQARDELLTQVGELIDKHLGGTITKQYLTILATATDRS
ncbi:MAG: hypothetical protein ACYCS7_15270 [Acidimicrobiales bacterium]